MSAGVGGLVVKRDILCKMWGKCRHHLTVLECAWLAPRLGCCQGYLIKDMSLLSSSLFVPKICGLS